MKPDPAGAKSFSLMTDEIPLNRTCQEAGISQAFCSCDLIHHEVVDSRTEDAKRIGELFVERVNKHLEPVVHLCQPVFLDKVATVTKAWN